MSAPRPARPQRCSAEGERALPLLRRRWPDLTCPEKFSSGRRKRVDRLALTASIVVIDAVALIMPVQDSCAHEVGTRAAPVRLPGCANPRPHFRLDFAFGFGGGFAARKRGVWGK